MTSIIISNFVYLISFKNGDNLEFILERKVNLWWRGFSFTVVALVGIFLFNLFGVVAAWLRAQKKDDKWLEWIRAWICFPVVLMAGLTAITFSLLVIIRQFTAP